MYNHLSLPSVSKPLLFMSAEQGVFSYLSRAIYKPSAQIPQEFGISWLKCEGQEEWSGELKASQTHSNPWESDGVNHPGNYFQT